MEGTTGEPKLALHSASPKGALRTPGKEGGRLGVPRRQGPQPVLAPSLRGDSSIWVEAADFLGKREDSAGRALERE